MSASAALEEQAVTAEEIARTMTETSDLIVAVQSGMKAVAHSVHTSEETATELNSAAARLSSDTEALGTEVSRFLRQVREG